MRGYVLLGDVVGSRDIPEREAFQRRLETVCEAATDDHQDAFQARLDLLVGLDEVGGVLTTVEPLYDVLTSVYDGIDPHRIRFVCVEGEIDVGWEAGDVREMDGPAFHVADETLERIEREALWFDMVTDDGGRAQLFGAIAGVINPILYLRREMTDHQREIAAAYEQLGTQVAVAEEFDVSQQAVSKAMAGSNWPMLRTLEDRIRDLLAGVDG